MIALALALLPQSALIELAEERVVVPMSHANRCVGVTVEIGGESYAFQVDTYASIDACLDDDVAAALGLEKIATTTNSDGRTERTRDIVRLPALTLGDASWTEVRVLVDDYDWLETATGRRVDGLLGFPLFRDVLLTFDYPGDRLVLERGALSADAPHTVPFEGAGRAPDVRILVGERRLRFGIDTGHSGSLSLPLSDAEALPLLAELVVIGRARTVYSEYEILGASLADTLDLAGHRVTSPRAQFSEGGSSRLLGYALLRPFAVTFDQRNARMRWTRAPLPEAAALTDDELDRFVGRYAAPGARFVVEREGTELFLQREGDARRPLIALSPDELRMRDYPVHLRRDEDSRGRAVLLVIDHPQRPVVEARRIDRRG